MTFHFNQLRFLPWQKSVALRDAFDEAETIEGGTFDRLELASQVLSAIAFLSDRVWESPCYNFCENMEQYFGDRLFVRELKEQSPEYFVIAPEEGCPYSGHVDGTNFFVTASYWYQEFSSPARNDLSDAEDEDWEELIPEIQRQLENEIAEGLSKELDKRGLSVWDIVKEAKRRESD